MQLADFQKLVRRYARIPQEHAMTEALKLAHVLTTYSQQQVMCALRAFPDAPVLWMHGSDDWGCDVPKTVCRLVPNSGLKVTRNGRLRQEFLLQRGFLRRRRPGGTHALIAVVGNPRGLGCGRSAFHIMAAIMEWQPLLRGQGFNGPQATIYLLDGISFDCLSRKLLARHDIFYEGRYDADDVDGVLLRSSDLAFCI